MKQQFLGLGFAVLFLANCASAPSQFDISDVPAGAEPFRAAQEAAALCAKDAPDWKAVEARFKASGYARTKNNALDNAARAQKAVVLEAVDSDVVVLIGASTELSGERSGACIISLPGMTPQQSYELALPWVRKYGAVTNAERGQGLSKKAVQAWGAVGERRIVYIAAYKSADILQEPGASVRLLIVVR